MKHILLEVLQNVLMGIPPIARVARMSHSTGLNADPVQSRRLFEFYTGFAPVAGKDILEIGPGHTLEVLDQAVKAGARSCTAVDVVEYVSSERVGRTAVQYRTYDGKKLPFESDQFDLLWSHTAFEHLRYPAMTVAECFRVLRPAGKLISLIDLGDHSYYGKEVPPAAMRFDCLRYPEWLWNLMKWNRSSYVNRLRKSEWITLLSNVGFRCVDCQATESEEVGRSLHRLGYLHRFTREDATTAVLIVSVEKPDLRKPRQ